MPCICRSGWSGSRINLFFLAIFFLSNNYKIVSANVRLIYVNRFECGGSFAFLGNRIPAYKIFFDNNVKKSLREQQYLGASYRNLKLLYPEFAEKRNHVFDASMLTKDQPPLRSLPHVDSSTAEILQAKGIVDATPIQALSIGPIYGGKDIIGRSQTGSGKTLAFALPLVQKLVDNNDFGKRGSLPKVLILDPTRELSRQVQQEFQMVGSHFGVRTACFHGGVNYGSQFSAITDGIDILVATPGRLKDHLEKGTLNLKDVKHVVLDEADEMLNMGFADDVERILKSFDITRAQVLLYSATTPNWVRDISARYLKNPLSVDCSSKSSEITAEGIRHIAMRLPVNSVEIKANLLEDIVSVYTENPLSGSVEETNNQCIVFCDTKKEADELSSEGAFKTYSASVLHGDIGQQTREHTINRFKQALFRVLVATDVAARGIDVKGVSLVVQCSPPQDPNTYVHRSGRTARGGRKGICVVLFSDNELSELRRIEQQCGLRFEYVTPPSAQLVMESAASGACKTLDSINVDVLAFYQQPAEEVIQRAHKADVDIKELVARCLAVIARKTDFVERSLISGVPMVRTLKYSNIERPWKDALDVENSIMRLSEDLGLALTGFNGVRLPVTDKSEAFFDLPIDVAESLEQTANRFLKALVEEKHHDSTYSQSECTRVRIKSGITALPELQRETNRQTNFFDERRSKYRQKSRNDTYPVRFPQKKSYRKSPASVPPSRRKSYWE